jgi:hypothetical protein
MLTSRPSLDRLNSRLEDPLFRGDLWHGILPERQSLFEAPSTTSTN